MQKKELMQNYKATVKFLTRIQEILKEWPLQAGEDCTDSEMNIDDAYESWNRDLRGD
ncbi:MAG: hypothetical protein MN733_20630 [Nitrososphaera sp.]|nr:hypothetical protein [Nitrososphaera sp.]